LRRNLLSAIGELLLSVQVDHYKRQRKTKGPVMTNNMNIAVAVIKALGASRAKDGTHIHSGGPENKTGYAGVDLPKGSRKYRARICFMDSLSGAYNRLTLGRFDDAEDAGYAYKVAHVALWGSLSCFVGEVTVAQIEAVRAAGLADPTYAARGDNSDVRGL
jgi:hypothetical protein